MTKTASAASPRWPATTVSWPPGLRTSTVPWRARWTWVGRRPFRRISPRSGSTFPDFYKYASSSMAQDFSVHPDAPQPRLIHQAAEIIRKGGLVALPTDSAYALAGLRSEEHTSELQSPLNLVC